MKKAFLLFFTLLFIITAFGQTQLLIKSIDSLIASKVHRYAEIPAIRISAGYPSGKNGMSFLPDAASNQLAEVHVYRPKELDSVSQITYYFGNNELIKTSIVIQNSRERDIYFCKRQVVNESRDILQYVQEEYLLNKANEYVKYFHSKAK